MASRTETEAAHYAMSQRNAARAYYSALLDNPNVQRGLNVIKTTEGTIKQKDPYATAFGGGTIKSLRDHPRQAHSFTQKDGKKNKTTAAGAYQFLSKTWDRVATKLGLTDFSKMSQDLAALALIDGRKGLSALINGDLVGFINAVGPEWASLPTAPAAYSQPKVGWNAVKQAWDSTIVNPSGPISPEAIAAAYNHPSRAKDVPQVSPETIARAYNDPFRALDTVPNRPALRPDNFAYGGPKGTFSVDRPGSLPSVPSGQVTRGPSLAAPAVNRSASPANPGQLGGIRMSSPSAPAVDRSVAPSNPGQLGGLRMSAPSMPSNLNSAPAGQVTRGPALSAPAVDRSVSPANPGQLGGVTMSSPKGDFSVGPSTADLAAQYASYRTPTAYQNVRTAMQQPAAPPALATPPAPVLAPALAPPTVIQPRPVAPPIQNFVRPEGPVGSLPAARPSLTAGDIYGGQIGSALDNTGLNTVSRDAFGTTSVTNKYGATTGMTPGGYQTAYGSMPSVPGISGPTASKIGGAIKGAVPGVAGSALGGLLAGPMGAMLGAALAKAVTSPGGLLSNQNNFKTDFFGNVVTNKPQSGGAFPDAPGGGYKGSASFSNRSEGGMRGISPGAADAIGRGVGGLY